MSHKYLFGLLPVEGDEPVDLEGKLQLEYYKLEKTLEGEIKLNEEKGIYEPSTETGASGKQEKFLLMKS